MSDEQKVVDSAVGTARRKEPTDSDASQDTGENFGDVDDPKGDVWSFELQGKRPRYWPFVVGLVFTTAIFLLNASNRDVLIPTHIGGMLGFIFGGLLSGMAHRTGLILDRDARTITRWDSVFVVSHLVSRTWKVNHNRVVLYLDLTGGDFPIWVGNIYVGKYRVLTAGKERAKLLGRRMADFMGVVFHVYDPGRIRAKNSPSADYFLRFLGVAWMLLSCVLGCVLGCAWCLSTSFLWAQL